jgi:hypothetical protein
VCLFAPYGTFDFGGGTLRLDHFAVWALFAVLAIGGRLHFRSPLAVALLVFVAETLIGTTLHLNLVSSSYLEAAKSADGLLRGPLVMLIASSMDSRADMRPLHRTIVAIAIALAVLGLLDRILPRTSPFLEMMIDRYGGPKRPLRPYGDWVTNHKELMTQAHRATAVFVTAPSLGMVMVFFLVLVITPEIGFSRTDRVLLMIAAMAGGLASNSKSFVAGLGIILALFLLFGGGASRRSAIVPSLVVVLVAWLSTSYFESGDATGGVNPLARAEEQSLGHSMTFYLTGGRLGSERWSAWDPLVAVLGDAPAFGYGLGQNEDVIYSDSGVNMIVLRGGLVGLLIVGTGIALQWTRMSSGVSWARVGRSLMIVCLAFFFAGAVFVMPRLNDVFFTLLGVSIARSDRRDDRERGDRTDGN